MLLLCQNVKFEQKKNVMCCTFRTLSIPSTCVTNNKPVRYSSSFNKHPSSVWRIVYNLLYFFFINLRFQLTFLTVLERVWFLFSFGPVFFSFNVIQYCYIIQYMCFYLQVIMFPASPQVDPKYRRVATLVLNCFTEFEPQLFGLPPFLPCKPSN